MSLAIILPGFLACATVQAADERERRIDADEERTSRPTLGEVHALLERREADWESVRSLGPISLAGFNYSRTADLGKGRTVVAVSCNLGGGLLGFAANGELLGVRRTSEQASLQLVDLDGDGQDEVITIEKDVVGTGILGWTYHVYRLVFDRWEHLWSGVSYERISIGKKSEVQEGVLRVADLGSNNPRLVYAKKSGRSHWSTSEWVLDGDRFRRSPARVVREEFK